MNSTIQLRIDSKMKKQAQSIFEKLGLDLTSGVKLYLTQVIREKGIPFQARTVNGLTPQYEARILKDYAHAIKHAKRYSNVDEALRDVLK
jgi:DNA-damage-inducible protein J